MAADNVDGCISAMEHLIKTLSGITERGVRADHIGSLITHYVSKWLPELADEDEAADVANAPPEVSAKASWTKKRLFIETLVGILPPEKDCVPCNFLLRLLRAANVVRVGPAYRDELEERVAWLLDQASLKELMIPCFSHTRATLLDVELVVRLVKMFVVGAEEVTRSGAALGKVARLVDCYLAEAALDSCMAAREFIELASAVPSHARSMDDGLYRAIDTYFKAHPGLSKQERKTLCSLMDMRKLSQEASLHAAQNERVPVRTAIQILLSEQTKLNKHIIDWSGSLNGLRSPGCIISGFDHPSRSFSRVETVGPQLKIEMKWLKEDVVRLQRQCMAMEAQMEKMMMEKKRGYGSYFSLKKLGIIIPVFKENRVGEEDGDIGGGGLETPTPARGVVRGRNKNRRKSMS